MPLKDPHVSRMAAYRRQDRVALAKMLLWLLALILAGLLVLAGVTYLVGRARQSEKSAPTTTTGMRWQPQAVPAAVRRRVG